MKSNTQTKGIPARRIFPLDTISLDDLEGHIRDWIFWSSLENQTDRTIEEKRNFGDKLLWFYRHRSYEHIGLDEVKEFVHYLRHGHKEPGGRWGNPVRGITPLSPITIKNYYIYLSGLYTWMKGDGLIIDSPIDSIPKPKAKRPAIVPFTEGELKALLNATKRSQQRLRNEAMHHFLLDTGIRETELSEIKLSQVDLSANRRRVRVLGKGNKERTVYFGKNCTRTLWAYLRSRPDLEDDDHLFISGSGRYAGNPLTRSGIYQIVSEWGEMAGIKATRCSPHTYRHTFAYRFLDDGGDVFTLQQLLGHSNISQTEIYVNLKRADMERQHRAHSPSDRIKWG